MPYFLRFLQATQTHEHSTPNQQRRTDPEMRNDEPHLTKDKQLATNNHTDTTNHLNDLRRTMMQRQVGTFILPSQLPPNMQIRHTPYTPSVFSNNNALPCTRPFTKWCKDFKKQHSLTPTELEAIDAIIITLTKNMKHTEENSPYCLIVDDDFIQLAPYLTQITLGPNDALMISDDKKQWVMTDSLRKKLDLSVLSELIELAML